MTQITEIRSRTLRIPLDNPTSFSNRTVYFRDHPIIEIECDDGHTGIGFCYAGNSNGALVTQTIRELLAPVILGEDPFRVEGLWKDMYQEALLHGRAGAVVRAISAIDIALWDHNAKSVELPLWKLLGGFYKDVVPAYASGGYYLDGKSYDGLAQELTSYVDQGFKAVKIKVGRLSISEEAERMRVARAAIGDDVALMLDANNAFQNLETALQYMRRAYEPYDPYWMEEPFSPDEIDIHGELARRTHVPIATGEIEAGRWRFKELLDKKAAMIIQPDAAVLGGITEFRRIAATAGSYGISVAPHWFHDLHLHLVAGLPNGTFVEFFPDDQVLSFRRVIDHQTEVRDGSLVLPDRPGIGFGFRSEALEQYGLDDWESVRA
tara:strand:- start:133 stop:1269 length:1137 start_codon:yes stop_codon:yes gene_type:complete